MKLRYAQIALLIFFAFQISNAQTSAFTYQGKLTDGGSPASGNYDLTFRLFDAPSGGSQIGIQQQKDDVAVSGGTFTVVLDFGASPFTSNTGTYLEISVRPGVSSGAFTTLTPRQPITSSPYAVQTIRAESAATADSATNFTGILNGDVNGGQGTTLVTRIQGRNVTSAPPTSGQSLVWNSPSSQWEPGTINFVTTAGNANQLGGVAASQYVQTSDSRLSNARAPTAGSANYIQNGTGVQAGSDFNISGDGKGNRFDATTEYRIGGFRVLSRGDGTNLFAGVNSGANNSTGSANAFFGDSAGFGNSTGQRNVFVGTSAGLNNLTGNDNTFVGYFTGISHNNGSNNTLLGAGASQFLDGLNYSTAIGAGAVVSSDNTVVLGRNLDTVQVPGALLANTFSASIVNAATQFNIAGNRILGINGNASNLSVGLDFGLGSGPNTGSNNSFFGGLSGINNSSGDSNTFAGHEAGRFNTSGGFNSFFGAEAGRSSTTSDFNTFVGGKAGRSNQTGRFNSFLGGSAGQNTNGNGSPGSGSNNSFFGINSGISNSVGSNNTIFGMNADVGAGDLKFATAVGSHAVVPVSDMIVLGKSAGTYDGVEREADTVVIPGFTNIISGLLVQTPTVGNLATFAGNGIFEVDSATVQGGRFRITGDGGVTIGTALYPGNLRVHGPTTLDTTVINSTLDVLNDVNVQNGSVGAGGGGSKSFRFDRPTGNFNLGNDGRMIIGNVGLQPGKLAVGGFVSLLYAPGGVGPLCSDPFGLIAFCGSSVRYKQNIGNFTSGLDLLRRLRPVTFNWKANDQADMGLVAEEVAEIEPLLVTYNNGQIEGVKYDRVGVVLVNAVKEQQEQIEQQRTEIEELRRTVDALRAAVCSASAVAPICGKK